MYFFVFTENWGKSNIHMVVSNGSRSMQMLPLARTIRTQKVGGGGFFLLLSQLQDCEELKKLSGKAI